MTKRFREPTFRELWRPDEKKPDLGKGTVLESKDELKRRLRRKDPAYRPRVGKKHRVP